MLHRAYVSAPSRSQSVSKTGATRVDWHESKIIQGKQLCTILDDASRKISAAGEFDNATVDNSLKVLTEAIEKYGILYPIRSVISDHRSQFLCQQTG